jgi:D-threo-aldose 1-dehydrogenase
MIAKRRLPDGPLELSELSLGCAQLGNMYREVPDSDSRSTVDAAWEGGVRSFDTAPHYGLGLSERRLGAALAPRPRDAYVLSSKVGRLLEPVERVEGLDGGGFAVSATHRRVWDFSRDGIRRSLEESLGRLGLDRLDIVYLHDPDEHWSDVLATGYPALEELRAAGIVGAIGAGMNQSKMLADLVRETDVDVVMLAGRYTLVEQDALDDLLPACLERGVAVVAAAVFNSGLLARARPGDDAKYDYGDAPRALVERAQAIARICERHGTTLPAAALAFPLAHRAVASVCIGARTAAQVQRNVALHAEVIAPDLWSELKAEGLLRDDAPVPGSALRRGAEQTAQERPL